MSSGPSRSVRPDRGFWLSHHAPARFDRTLSLRIGRRAVRACARCTGQLLGFSALLLASLGVFLFGAGGRTWPPEFLFALAPLPAAVDWLTQTIGWRESRNAIRIVTGALLGAAFGELLRLLGGGAWVEFALGLVVMAVYVSAIALTLRITGAWRRVLEEHFPGIGPVG